jgi:hypothetical protein
MSLNGAGVYSLPAGNPVVTGTTISSTWANTTLTDIGTALSTAIFKDGQQTLTANIPMSGFKFTGLAAGTDNGNSVRYEQVIKNEIVDAAGDYIVGTAADTVAKNPAYTTVAANATTSDIWTARYNLLTGGVVTFTDVADAPYQGAQSIVVANAAHVLTDGANLEVMGDANYTCTAGDVLVFTAKTTTTFQVSIFKANGTPVVTPSYAQWTISTTRGGNAETITVTPVTGAVLRFRNATIGTGDYTNVDFSSAITLTLSSGSTIGATNSVPFRVWLVAFNDAGTLRLGAVKTVSGTDIMHLRADQLYSSTAEGGAGAADSAQVIYSTTAVTTKAMVILGYAEYTLATVGTWGTAPSKVQIFGDGVPLPGDTVQEVTQITGAVSSGSTVLPGDNTTPQNTEGDQYMTKAIVPKSAANILEHDVLGHFAASATQNMGMAMFQDSTANALASSFFVCSGANIAGIGKILYRMIANTTSSTTFNVRAGGGSAGTTTFNGRDAGTGFFNSTITSHIKIREIMA